MSRQQGCVVVLAIVLTLAGCSPATPSGSERAASVEPSEAPVASASPSEAMESFPIESFAGLGDEPGSDDVAAELQKVLDESANGDGLTAAVISPLPMCRKACGQEF